MASLLRGGLPSPAVLGSRSFSVPRPIVIGTPIRVAVVVGSRTSPAKPKHLRPCNALDGADSSQTSQIALLAMVPIALMTIKWAANTGPAALAVPVALLALPIAGGGFRRMLVEGVQLVMSWSSWVQNHQAPPRSDSSSQRHAPATNHWHPQASQSHPTQLQSSSQAGGSSWGSAVPRRDSVTQNVHTHQPQGPYSPIPQGPYSVLPAPGQAHSVHGSQQHSNNSGLGQRRNVGHAQAASSARRPVQASAAHSPQREYVHGQQPQRQGSPGKRSAHVGEHGQHHDTASMSGSGDDMDWPAEAEVVSTNSSQHLPTMPPKSGQHGYSQQGPSRPRL